MKIDLYREILVLVQCPECGGYGSHSRMKIVYVEIDEETGYEREHWAEYPEPCEFCQTTGYAPILLAWKKL